MATPTGAASTSGSAAGAPADPYLSDDFHPLRSASAHILAALRADESAPDADLYRRLVSSGGAGAHRYHPVKGEEGLGEPGGTGGRSERNGGGRRPSPSTGGSGNVIGSPLGVLRGSRASTSNTGTTNGSPSNTSGSSTKPASPPTPYLRHERSLPLPAPLAAEAAKAQLSSSMGLLPAAQLAWLSADHKLFLWSYAGAAGEGGGNTVIGGGEGWGSSHAAPQAARQDYCSFAVPSGQCVVSVGLVRPKRGVFTRNVEWCLVVTTPEEAVLCALAKGPLDPQGTQGENGDASATAAGGFRHGSDAVLRLIPTRFVLPTDAVPLLSVAGTADGRIFLGGTDGGLYEMSYEGNRPTGGMNGGMGHGGAAAGSEAMERAIDEYFDGRGVFSLDSASSAKDNAGLDVGGVLAGGKRVLSALTFGALDDQSSTNTIGQRPRKCRKIDHSSRAPALASRVLPPALLRAGSGVFGSALGNEARKGGPIVSIVIDEERRCLYTLGSKGVVCAYDLSPLPHGNAAGNASQSLAAPPPRLASVLDAPSTAKLYLDAVSRGRMYPPTTSQKLALGTIAFPGGSAGAQAGVGGMDGARDLLKRYDAEGRALKAAAAGHGRGNGTRDALSNAAGILHPASLHLVPPSESKSLTLVAVTGGGLRYYLSSLSSTAVHAAQAQGGFAYGANRSTGRGDARAAMRPGRKMMFCHVRAPPPYATSSGEGNDGVRFEAVRAFARDATAGGLAPGIHAAGRSPATAAGGDVVRGWYRDGAFVLALDVERGATPGGATTGRADFFAAPAEGPRAARPAAGDAIVAALPDVAARSSPTPTPASGNAAPAPPTAPGGISEAVLLPLAGQGGTSSPVLPGGRTFDIAAGTDYGRTSSLAGLFVHSETPSDAELQVGPLPAFAPRPTRAPRPGAAGAAESSAMVVSKAHGRGVLSSALAALAHYLRSGPYGREVGTVGGARGFGPAATFRLSRRYGCGAGGFGPSAGEGAAASKPSARGGTSARNKQIVTTASTKAARLPAWLLRPSPAPLRVAAAQHLAPSGSPSDKVAILNAGGLHFFAQQSLPDALATALRRARNVATDATVRNFFVSYGYAEGCALCFALATSAASDDALRTKAAEAALCHARRPVMTLAGASIGEGLDPLSSYTFQPSSLYDGLVQCLSRLLRPVWHKPAVVVTEGRPLSVRSATARYYAALPAKVELLLDEATLGEVRRPLQLLQELMKARFVPAVRTVPGAKAATNAGDAMDVDEDGGRITQALRNQSRAAAQQRTNANQSQPAATPSDLQSAAYQTEDRNVHALYRLASRSVQLLDLLSCLRVAHEAQSLPDVAWGRLHGLTCAQLAIEREGQRRIDAVVNALVCRGGEAAAQTEGDRLADRLSRKCYLYFSAGARLAYLGFRAANDALARPSNSPQRGALANQAARYLRSAARHWHSPALVAGRSMSRDGRVAWEEAFANATEAGSPLALAADVLLQLGHVGGLADVCLICAANFGGGKVPRDARKEVGDDDAGRDALAWERGLYHRPPPEAAAGDSGNTASGSRAVVTGIDPTPADALRTCHGIVFHYMSQLLGDAGPENQRLADELVATCAASSDGQFLRSLYEHLLATNHEETLLRIDSPSLEAWLVDDKKDVGLQWKYHSFHGRHRLAGDAMYSRATEAGKVPLDRRIECLTRAANSYSSALELNPTPHLTARSLLAGQGTSPAVQDKPMTQNELEARVRNIEEQLDVATIQKRVLDTVAQSEGTDLDAAQTDALTYTLLSVSDIYNDFARPLNLFDVCLLILHTCKHNEGDTIATLWKSVLCEEVLPCATRSQPASEFLARLQQGSLLEDETVALGAAAGNAPTFEHGEWMPLLRNRVAALGRELFGKGADYAFPLDLLARELEGLRAVCDGARGEDGASPPWPAQTLLDAGVPFYELIEIYDSLLTEDDAAGGGVDATTRLQRLASLSELLQLWVTAALTSPLVSANSLGDREGSSASSQLARATNSGALLPRIEQYRLALQELGSGNPASSAIDERLTNVEEAIRKQYC